MRDCRAGRQRFARYQRQCHADPYGRTHPDTDARRESESAANAAEDAAGPAGHITRRGTAAASSAAHNCPGRHTSTSGALEASGLLPANQRRELLRARRILPQR